MVPKPWIPWFYFDNAIDDVLRFVFFGFVSWDSYGLMSTIATNEAFNSTMFVSSSVPKNHVEKHHNMINSSACNLFKRLVKHSSQSRFSVLRAMVGKIRLKSRLCQCCMWNWAAWISILFGGTALRLLAVTVARKLFITLKKVRRCTERLCFGSVVSKFRNFPWFFDPQEEK